MPNYCGLVNVGNFCYFISIIQNLRFTKSIIKYICDENEHSQDLQLLELIKNADEEFLKKNQIFFKKAVLYLNFKKLIFNMCSSKDNEPIHINDFLKSCYRVSIDTTNQELFSGNQNCSGEFIQFLLDILHNTKKKKNEFQLTFDNLKDCKSGKDVIIHNCEKSLQAHFHNHYSWIIKEFNITLCNKICCNNCEYYTINYEPLFILLVPIPLHLENINIEDCLDLYTKKEIFVENEEWICEKCNNKTGNYRQCKLYNSPSTLIIQLTRSKYNMETGYANKITSIIKYNEILNIKKYKLFNDDNENDIYELYGILCHIGELNSGHYYTYCKEDKSFHLFNDETVSINETFPIDKNAYILFYRLKN